MSQRNLFGLFVAIDQYQHVSNLGGCKADITQVLSYFQELSSESFSFQPKKLFDDQATKAGIVSAFKSHLIDQAGPGDVALFYFSGHGAQEHAHKMWWKVEPDRFLEGLVCHDTGKNAETMLIDKEQRYLIWQLSQKGCDIITIFDSCHSADNTRSLQGEVEMPKRRIAAKMPERKWSEFIFADTSTYGFSPTYTEQDFRDHAIDDVLKQGRHIQIAACQDHEFAYETSAGGAFTQGLLQALKDSQGKITYLDLQSRVRFAIKGRAGGPNQTPQMYYLYGHEEDAFKEFLSGAVQDRPLYGNIVWNRNHQEWILDKGAIHGMGRPIDGKDQLVVVPIKGYQTVVAKVGEVRPAETVVTFDSVVEDDYLDFDGAYEGFVQGMLSEPLYLWLEGDETGVQAIRDYVQSMTNKTIEDGTKLPNKWQQWNLFLAKTKEEANFRILANEKEDGKVAHYAITELNDPRPLVRQSIGLGEKSVEDLEGKLQVLSRWYFAKQLKNPATTLPEEVVKLTIIQDGQELESKDGIFEMAYANPDDDTPATKFKVKVENLTNQLLHVAVLYLDDDWSMTFKLVQQGVAKIEAGGEPLWLFGEREIPMKWHDKGFRTTTGKILDAKKALVAYGVPYHELFFQVIAATDSFQADLFAQAGIKRAYTPEELRDIPSTRSLELDEELELEEKEPIATNDWTTQRFSLRTKNPRL
ncbi:MAG: caspase family protein [Bacteroidota bacterium]